MNAYNDSLSTEEKSCSILIPRLQKKGATVLEIVGKEEQSIYGDWWINDYPCEFKAEEANKYGNFFLEEWSNKSRHTPGWMHKLVECQFLIYHFLEENLVYIIEFQKLKRWYEHNKTRFSLKPQGKHAQKNDTWGYCVPISIIELEVGFFNVEKQIT